MLSFSKLCPTCYKLRTIVKCYNAEDILKNAEEHFLVSHAREEEIKTLDKKFFVEEEARIQREFEEELATLQQKEKQYLETITEEEETKDLKELKKNNSTDSLEAVIPKEEDLDNTYMTRNKNKKYNKNKNKSI
tara:strand:+ start:572 stop:973 length:402 start_codon:yes stop_codon:yes gene_type:complete